MRTLHTLKGGARLAGAMRLGEMAHRLETRIERLTASDAPTPGSTDVEALQAVSDAMSHAFEALRSRDAQAYSDAVAAAVAPPPVSRAIDTPAPLAAVEPPRPVAAPVAAPVVEPPPIDLAISAAPRASGRGRGAKLPARGAAAANEPVVDPVKIDWAEMERTLGSGTASDPRP